MYTHTHVMGMKQGDRVETCFKSNYLFMYYMDGP